MYLGLYNFIEVMSDSLNFIVVFMRKLLTLGFLNSNEHKQKAGV